MTKRRSTAPPPEPKRIRRTRKPCPGCGEATPYAWREVDKVCTACQKKLRSQPRLVKLLERQAGFKVYRIPSGWASLQTSGKSHWWRNGDPAKRVEAALKAVLAAGSARSGRGTDSLELDDFHADAVDALYRRCDRYGHHDGDHVRALPELVAALQLLMPAIQRANRVAYAVGKRAGANELLEEAQAIESRFGLILGRVYRAGKAGALSDVTKLIEGGLADATEPD